MITRTRVRVSAAALVEFLSAPTVIAVFLLGVHENFALARNTVSVSSGVFAAVTATGFCVAAIALARDGSPVNAWTSFAVAAAMIPEQLAGPGFSGQTQSLGHALELLPVFPVAALLLRYPAERLSAMRAVLVGLCGAAVVTAPAVVQYRPDWAGRWLFSVLAVGLFAAATVVAALRVASSAGVTRQAVAPLAVAALAVFTASAVELLHVTAFPHPLYPYGPTSKLHDLRDVAVALVLVALVAAALRRSNARGVLARNALAGSGEPTAAHLQGALRECLADPQLRIWLSSSVDGEWLDLAGVTVAPTILDTAPRDRRMVPDADGAPLALIDVDRRLAVDDPGLFTSAISAVRLNLENARFDAQLEAQIRELELSRGRTLTAVANERRQIKLELDRGPRRRLVDAELLLGTATVTTVRDAVGAARSDVNAALGELRSMAHAVHPAVLSQAGLASALHALAEQAPITVMMTVADETAGSRLRTAVQSACYFMVSDAVTRAVQFGAPEVVAIVRIDSDNVDIEVWFDGALAVYGARPPNAARDRILALNGLFDVLSAEREGIRAVVPVIA